MKKLLALLCVSWSVPADAYVPNATEQAVLEAVLRDEVVSFSTGGHSFVGESQGIVPVTAASASQAMAARDRNARMPELKQPLLLSGALAATGSVAGRASGSISPIPPRQGARARRRARPWRASPRPVRRWPWSAARWIWPRTRSASAAASPPPPSPSARRQGSRTPWPRSTRASRPMQRSPRWRSTSRCTRRNCRPAAVVPATRRAAGVHRGGQAAEPGAQERRIAALARGRRGPERVQSAPTALVRALGATTRAGRQARRPWGQGLHRVPAPDSLPSPPTLRVRPDISRSTRLVGSR